MTENTEKPNYQPYIFAVGLVIFAVIAVFGWLKLPYGFNFIDEGYHMTKSWRLTMGDHCFDDQYMFILRPYTILNSLVFKISPDITLLGFRRLQFVFTLAALLFLSAAIYAVNREYGYFPFIFSVFAFTGLDPVGMISNMNYFTWPHLFITLALGSLIFAFSSKNKIIRNSLLLLSGCFLWLINLSLLHLGVIVLFPLMLYFLSRGLHFKHFAFDFKDCVLLSTPFFIGWLGFVVVYQKTFFITIFSSLQFFLSLSTYSPETLTSFNFWPLVYSFTAVMLILIYGIALKQLPAKASFIILPAFAILIYAIIETSGFGYIQPYYNGWFGRPMWFSAFLIGFYALFWFMLLKKYVTKQEINRNEEIVTILLIPATLLSIVSTVFSGLGPLTVLYSAIPGIAGLSVFFLHNEAFSKKQRLFKLISIGAILIPIYYITISNDWGFTFFDVAPSQMNVRIEEGFGKGIKTNALYGKLYEWVENNAKTFTKPDDFQLSYCVSPMTHMITKLRPSLEDTFISSEIPNSHYKTAIESMIKKGREPKIAFIFERMPILIPVSLEKGTVTFPGKQFDFMTSQDPISTYVKSRMTPGGTFKISEDTIIRCYVNHNLPQKIKSGQSHQN